MSMIDPTDPHHQLFREAVAGDTRDMMAELFELTDGKPALVTTELIEAAMVDWFGEADARHPVVLSIVTQTIQVMMAERAGLICLN